MSTIDVKSKVVWWPQNTVILSQENAVKGGDQEVIDQLNGADNNIQNYF